MSTLRFVVASSVVLLAARFSTVLDLEVGRKNGNRSKYARSTQSQERRRSLSVEYTFENPTDHPILVFDRLWDMHTNALHPNWAYVEIRGTRAAIKRDLDRMPEGLLHENPPVPSTAGKLHPKPKAAAVLSASSSPRS